MSKQRYEMVKEIEAGEQSLSAISRKYGVSRPTAYKWYERYLSGKSMESLSRAPKSHPRKTDPVIENLVLDERKQHDDWGARKLKIRLEREHGYVFPAHSTIHSILQRNNEITAEATLLATPYKCFVREHPNELWQCDFKGDFPLSNHKRCYPLNVVDDHSRFQLCLEALPGLTNMLVIPVFMRLFDNYGLPEALLCDNGNPWGMSSSAGGYTQFELFLMNYDILPIHTRFHRPQTQGKVERLNRTMTKPLLKRYGPFKDFTDAQYHFDKFREEYNTIRPHQALNFATPMDVYQISERKLPSSIKEWEYSKEYKVCRVRNGYVKIEGITFYFSESLNQQYIGIRHSKKFDTLLIFYRNFILSEYDPNKKVYVTKRIRRVKNKEE